MASSHNVNGVMLLFFDFGNKNIIRISLLILALVLLICLGNFRNIEEFKSVSSIPILNRVIVLDAGHGGFDAGASANGALEKEINLKVALCLKEYLEQGGAIVLLTRNSDASTAESGKEGVSAKKSDLAARKQLVDNSEGDLFISIHMNKFSQTQYHGAQVFYSDDQEKGKKLGDEIQQSLKDVLNDNNSRIAKKMDREIFLLKNTTIPSVIVECGFLSNPQEAKLLQSKEYQQKLAWGIYLGIVKYFNQFD